MKQTDKCEECGHEEDKHCNPSLFGSICKVKDCSCSRFKSHPQESLSRNKISNVRASEEIRKSKADSSVPYTPLLLVRICPKCETIIHLKEPHLMFKEDHDKEINYWKWKITTKCIDIETYEQEIKELNKENIKLKNIIETYRQEEEIRKQEENELDE